MKYPILSYGRGGGSTETFFSKALQSPNSQLKTWCAFVSTLFLMTQQTRWWLPFVIAWSMNLLRYAHHVSCNRMCMYVCMYMYIYICWLAVKLLSGPRGLLSGPSRGYYLDQVCLKLWVIVVSSDFCTLNYHLVFFWGPVVSQFSKNYVFGEIGCKCFFCFCFPCFEFRSWEISLFCLPKHYKNYGFQKIVAFSFQREDKGQTKLEFWILFFLVRFVTGNCYSNIGLLKPVVLWCFLDAPLLRSSFW